MKLAVVIALASACGGDDHSAIEHHHHPPPLSNRATQAERAELRSAIDLALTRVARGSRPHLLPPPPPPACDPLSTGCKPLHVDFVDWESSTAPASAVRTLVGAKDQIDGCLGAAPLTGRLLILIDQAGKVTDATVTGIGSHRGCVEDLLHGLDFPPAAAAYSLTARLVYN